MDEPLRKEERDQACRSIADDGSLVVTVLKLQRMQVQPTLHNQEDQSSQELIPAHDQVGMPDDEMGW